MNSPVTEPHSIQCKQEHAGTADSSSKACSSQKNRNVYLVSTETPVWSWPASNISVPGIVPSPHQHLSETLDPLSLSPVPAAPDGSRYYSSSASWFTKKPILCSMIPVVYNVSGDEQLALAKPQNTTESAPTKRDGAVTRAKEATPLGTSSQCKETARSIFMAQDQTVKLQLPARTAEMLSKSKSRKPCRCIKSQCLKLYCECFASRLLCSNCNCSNCHNNGEHELKRHKAIEWCLVQNPDAFMPKIAGGKSGEVQGRHKKGCNCKRSACRKRYCECYEASIRCTSSCKCAGCGNRGDSSKTGSKEKAVNAVDKWPVSVITPSVVESVCHCLLTQAEIAERDSQSSAQAERMVLEDFGSCLSQIAQAMFKNKTY